MPTYILHQQATVQCMHGGTASPTRPSTRVKVGGNGVALLSSPYSVSGCQFKTPVVFTPQPCVTGQFTTAAKRVRVEGQPVLLSDSQATCAPNGTGFVVIETQTRVRAD